MDAAFGKFFDSIGSFFTGGDNIPWCDRDIIAGCEKEVAESGIAENKNESLMRLSWALVHSRQPEDVNRGIAMLEASLDSSNSPLQMREKLYLLAVGHYRSGDYSGSRQLLERCLEEKRAEESAGATTGLILSLRESLQNCKDSLATCQADLEAAQSEIRKWHSVFQSGPANLVGTNPEPGLVISYLQNLKSSEDSLKEKLEKAKKKEAAFIVTYAKREQEIADLKSAVRDLKKQLRPPSIQSRKLLLDPAIHEEFTRLKNLVEEKEKKVKELQDNVAAVNFSANSRMGKMLMAKCRTLQEENEEIGAMASEGKIHELGMKIAVLKSQNAEIRSQFNALYKHMDELTNDVERSNELVLVLQDNLETKDYELEKLKDELRRTQEKLALKEEVLEKEETEPKKAAVEAEEETAVPDEEVAKMEVFGCDDVQQADMDATEADTETANSSPDLAS